MSNKNFTNSQWPIDNLINKIIPFNCAIRIDNKPLLHYDNVRLEQGFNEVPTFTIECSYDGIYDVKLRDAGKMNEYIGKPALLQFYQGFELDENSNDFSGIITAVYTRQKRLDRATLIIEGYAKCGLLNMVKQQRIYQEKDLPYIVNDIAQKYAGQVPIAVNSKKAHMHALVYQCEQTDFDFLNRHSFLCGEPFYWG